MSKKKLEGTGPEPFRGWYSKTHKKLTRQGTKAPPPPPTTTGDAKVLVAARSFEL